MAAEANVGSRESLAEPSKVSADWCDGRRIGRFLLNAEQSWLDLRAFETGEALRRLFARELLNLGLSDLDVSVALATNRALTQAVARWAYENGYQGIAYTSRFDIAFDCWAVFDNAAIEPILPFEPISRDDPDLLATAALFRLSL